MISIQEIQEKETIENIEFLQFLLSKQQQNFVRCPNRDCSQIFDCEAKKHLENCNSQATAGCLHCRAQMSYSALSNHVCNELTIHLLKQEKEMRIHIQNEYRDMVEKFRRKENKKVGFQLYCRDAEREIIDQSPLTKQKDLRKQINQKWS